MTDLHPTWTRSRATDPGTSHEAAEAIAPHVSQLQREILTYFAHFDINGSFFGDGLTDLELERLFSGRSPSSVRTRRSELAQMGLLEPAGTRVIKGRSRTVWRLAQVPAARPAF
jgi:hypothetical protein